MNNISFKAELKVNQNLYKNLPAGTPKEFPDKLIGDFENFLKIPQIKKATEGDVIEISKAKHRGGFGIDLNFITKATGKVFQTGVYTNKQTPEINVNDLKYWTYMFLCDKKGESPRTFESSFRMIERVLFNGNRVFKR